MKSIYVILTLFLYSHLTAQDYRWAKSAGGTGADQSTAIVSNSNGEVYLVGSFEDTVDFDPNTGIGG